MREVSDCEFEVKVIIIVREHNEGIIYYLLCMNWKLYKFKNIISTKVHLNQICLNRKCGVFHLFNILQFPLFSISRKTSGNLRTPFRYSARVVSYES